MTAQTSLFEQPEIQERDRILEDLEAKRAVWIGMLRNGMRLLYGERAHDVPWIREHNGEIYVTTDDARALFESWDVPAPDVLSRNFMGSIFRENGWRCLGLTHSAIKGSHGNLIRKWSWRG